MVDGHLVPCPRHPALVVPGPGCAAQHASVSADHLGSGQPRSHCSLGDPAPSELGEPDAALLSVALQKEIGNIVVGHKDREF